MPFIGNAPARVPLTSADITDGIISSADIANGAITAAKLAAGVGGKVLQVVTATTTTSASTSSATYIDTNLSASITPSSASNKILIIVSQNGCHRNNSTSAGLNLRLMKDSTAIQTMALAAFYIPNVNTEFRSPISSSYLDSPATTSAITYKTQFSNDGAGTGTVTVQYNTTSSPSTIILMEISA